MICVIRDLYQMSYLCWLMQNQCRTALLPTGPDWKTVSDKGQTGHNPGRKPTGYPPGSVVLCFVPGFCQVTRRRFIAVRFRKRKCKVHQAPESLNMLQDASRCLKSIANIVSLLQGLVWSFCMKLCAWISFGILSFSNPIQRGPGRRRFQWCKSIALCLAPWRAFEICQFDSIWSKQQDVKRCPKMWSDVKTFCQIWRKSSRLRAKSTEQSATFQVWCRHEAPNWPLSSGCLLIHSELSKTEHFDEKIENTSWCCMKSKVFLAQVLSNCAIVAATWMLSLHFLQQARGVSILKAKSCGNSEVSIVTSHHFFAGKGAAYIHRKLQCCNIRLQERRGSYVQLQYAKIPEVECVGMWKELGIQCVKNGNP